MTGCNNKIMLFMEEGEVVVSLENRRGKPNSFTLPIPMIVNLGDFLLDRRTGNVRINIKDGRILGYHTEEIVSL